MRAFQSSDTRSWYWLCFANNRNQAIGRDGQSGRHVCVIFQSSQMILPNTSHEKLEDAMAIGSL